MLLVSLAAAFLRQQGYIDHDTTLRVVAMNGLMIAYYGNLAPKGVAPSAYARQLARFSGWALVLSGLVYAGFWAFAPIPLAMTVGTGAVAVGIIATMGYCLWLWNQARGSAS
ncbi:ammonium transporter [Mesorhizobium loti]|nr:ammonium transporter [Mesorhizobium loti]